MAVHQTTNMPAVSLPNGASSLPLEVLPLLERFDKIYLWMDHDEPGQAGVDNFVRKLVRVWAFWHRVSSPVQSSMHILGDTCYVYRVEKPSVYSVPLAHSNSDFLDGP